MNIDYFEKAGNQAEEIRSKYPVGTKVRLLHMEDTQAPPDGTEGVVEHVDDIGTIFCRWSNGSGLGLVEGIDRFEIIT